MRAILVGDLAGTIHQGSLSCGNELRRLRGGLNFPVQVILDVGAEILELNNLEVAEYWLRMTPDNVGVQAVVFVNESDEICVLDRHGRVDLLQISPFAKQLEGCIIFLDEAHTRGIDLRLPPAYRAAVTLGSAITKDKLVQGGKPRSLNSKS